MSGIGVRIEMKVEPIYQGQHRISQVYLKQFGYEKSGEWMLSVYEVGKKVTSNVKIIEFTKRVNIFDLPFEEPELKRHFENKSQEIENRYPRIISNIHNQKRISLKDNDILNHFVANILCRSEPFRSFVQLLLKTPETRTKFINEITMFSDDYSELTELLSIFSIENQINIAIGDLMNHLVHIFRSFKKIIIKDYDSKGWQTSDNPVFIDKQGHYEWIIPIESEIYVPLSKNYCLFMFHPKSELNTNPLRNLNQNKINKVGYTTFENIIGRIFKNHHKYMIFSTEIDELDVIN